MFTCQTPIRQALLCHRKKRPVYERAKKLLHAVQDETYRQGLHELHETQKMADEVCRYDLDELDSAWLAGYNETRKEHGNQTTN